MAPMTTKPTPTAWDILMNSRLSAAQEAIHQLQGWPTLFCSLDESLTLCTPVHELCSISEEVLWDVCNLLQLIGHLDDSKVLRDVEGPRVEAPMVVVCDRGSRSLAGRSMNDTALLQLTKVVDDKEGM